MVEYYQLAQNVRNPQTGQVTAKILHNFGRADALAKDQLSRLCESIARVCEVELQSASPADERGARGIDWPADLQVERTLEFGTLVLVEGVWEQLELGSTLRAAAASPERVVHLERALLAMVANRLCEPSSKLGIFERWLKRVYAPSCWALKRDQLYEAMDFLYEHVDEVEESVFFRTANLFNLEVDLIFYDTTTAEFSVSYEDEEESLEEGGSDSSEPLRRWGRDKSGGHSVQVVIALAVTKEGLPVRSWVFPGNTTDSTTIERVRADLRAWKLGRCILVGDAGMNSEANRAELARGAGKYILATRLDGAEVRDEVLSRRGRYRKLSENLYVKEVVVGEGERRRRYALCYNPHEAKRQKARRDEVVTWLHGELARHSSRNVRAKWTVGLRNSARTGPYLSVDDSGELYVDMQKVRAAGRLDGKWVVLTNDDTLAVDEVATSYKAMSIIERCFLAMKSGQIEIDPMFHRLDRRIVAHVKLCVLGLLIERLAEWRCQMTWMRIRDRLRTLQATEYTSSGTVFFRRNRLTDEAADILKRMAIQAPAEFLGLG